MARFSKRRFVASPRRSSSSNHLYLGDGHSLVQPGRRGVEELPELEVRQLNHDHPQTHASHEVLNLTGCNRE